MALRAVFKAYGQHQPTYLPQDLEELIGPKHLVRVVSVGIDEMDHRELQESYVGGGASRYHPVMLLKVLVYCYTQRIYSSRQIAKAIRENVHCMWLAGANRPDFRTISRFRSGRLKRTLEEVFRSMVGVLVAGGLIQLEDCFVNGTKIEANANRYSFVKWAVEKNKTRVNEKIKDLQKEIDRLQEEEDRTYGDRDLEELGEESTLTVEQIREHMKKLNEKLRQQRAPKEKKRLRKLMKAAKILEGGCLVRLERYERQEKIFCTRDSFSKTDRDETFMRMKEDHMLNGQLKPGYSVQVSTENRYVVHYSIHQRPTDTGTFKEHLAGHERMTGQMPKRVVADAGYGSLENYQYLDDRNVEAYVKDNTFDKERTRSYRKDIFDAERFPYDTSRDEFTCPAGQAMRFVETISRISERGNLSQRRVYQAEDCSGCSLRSQCYHSQYDRRIAISHDLMRFKEAVRQRLNSPLGLELVRRRMYDTETVFAQIKHNRHFRRFLTRGMDNVSVANGLLSLAHNMINLTNDPRRIYPTA